MSLYTPAGFFLVRSPALPLDPYVEALDGRGRQARDHLWTLGEQPLVRQAIGVASRSLAAELDRNTPGAGGRSADRMHSSLLRYLSRMCSRPTPYGLFAQVAVGRFGEATTLARAGERPAASRTRADMGWLMELVKEMEADPALRGELTVRANPLLQHIAGRITLPVTQAPGTADRQSSSVRATRVVTAALTRAAGRPRGSDLIAAMAGEFPTAPPEKIRQLVDRLWDLGMLTSDLRPAPTHPHPEQAVLDRLEGIHHAERHRRALRRTRQLATAADQAGPDGGGGRLLAELAEHQRTVVPGHTQAPFHVDARLDLLGTTLHAQVASEAADAAEVLLRLGGQAPRLHHLAVYHREFLERYGLGAEVPVLDLLSPETGLDAPETYRFPPRALPLTPAPRNDPREQDAALAALAAAALRQGQSEVEITDDFLEAWRPRDEGGSGPDARPSLDVMGQVVAGSRQQLDSGDWKFVLSTGSMRDGGRFAGRFFDLLGEDFRKELREYAAAEEELCPGTVFAELEYAQMEARRGNVAIHPPLRRHEICVNATPTEGGVERIDLSDVLVGATRDRFYLRSARHGRQLHVTQSHLVNWGSAPNVCRFLLEVSEDGWAPLAEFSWGSLGRAPFLPRVTRGRIVLKPARWLFGSDVPGSPADCADAADGDAFLDAFRAWRQTWRVPRWVHLSLFDHRLLLDLDNPLCAEEIQRALRTSYGPGGPGALVLEEAVADPTKPSWLRDVDGRSYANEIVVPLLARKTAVERPLPAMSPAAAATLRERGADPAGAKRRTAGGDWTHLKLYAAVARHDDILADALPALVRGLRDEGLIDRWFFIRYADPHPHLRIRVRKAPGAAVAAPLTRLVGWAKELVDAGLASDLAVASYDRETERYGGPLAMDAAEAVFEANSDMATRLLGLLRGRPGIDTDTVTAYALDVLHRQWAPPGETAAAAVRDVPPATRDLFRTVRRTLGDLIAPWDAHPDPPARQWSHDLAAVLARQAPAVAAAGERVRDLARSGHLVGTEHEILDSLAHMQFIRLVGLDRDREIRSHHLRALALRAVQGRPGAGGGRP
ncbi:thiopeptide-type bacteriocin biosynthesis domain protein (plasmid) [Streptomyces globosus]|uniref:Thiopeptide-type bacteriocin biosynthesis domain protein n=1 Tax=Streptomyces globosus TaxID=68209 RepID=A0A344UBG0_9ACTN|nr:MULTISPECIES: lantibiotic dehydratase [Streptomyces]AXE28231.1 thiopeptide-type bacteriocin biosynthesis domain protein [Streptomyces globosus]